jgi:hypothetical protein
MNDSDPVSYVGITPLYDFTCDSNELQLDQSFAIRGYDETLTRAFLSSDDVFFRSLSALPPNYLLFHKPSFSSADYHQFFTTWDTCPPFSDPVSIAFYQPTLRLFRLLRLFRPGRLRGGDTYVIARFVEGEREHWRTLNAHRCTRMTIDPFIPSKYPATYSLTSEDAQLLASFRNKMSPILERVAQSQPPFASLELAFDLYAREDFEDVEIVNSLTALEALLLNDSKSELTYRLSMRVAYLLGTNDETRKRLFRDVKEFYDLRSTIVHGSQIKPKHQSRLEQSNELREIVRIVLLTILALIGEGMNKSQIDQLLDEIIFDGFRRLQVQKSALELQVSLFHPPVRVQ